MYILVNWYYFRRREYGLYSAYIIILTLYFLNKYLGDHLGMYHIGPVMVNVLYPDKILAVLSYIFYFKFGRRFVETKTRYPSIDRFMILTEKVLFAYIGIDIILLITTGYSTVENLLFVPVNLSIFIVLVFVFRAMIKKNEVLDRFILTGSMFYAISAFITLWLGFNKDPLYNDHMLALQVGALIEMVSLNAGLVYKSRMLEREIVYSQQQLIKRFEENQELMMRLANIRERISRDLHDDVGATLSSIKAYSEILKTNPKNLQIAELISNNSAEMIESLEVIAWTTNPTHDHFSSLKSMMRKFAVPLCHAKNIDFSIHSESIHEKLQIPGEIRQHLFLIFKESINNIIKYSEATECRVCLTLSNKLFCMEISDNGKGFDGTIKGGGNGIYNMRKRAKDLSATLDFDSEDGKGTSLIVCMEYPFKIPNSWDRTTD